MALPEDDYRRRPVAPKANRAWHVDLADLPLNPDERRDELRSRVGALIRSDDFSLPPLPGIAQEVFVAAARPDIAARELARIVHRDAFIAGRVLRVANSAHYGFGRPADTLQAALVRIGVDELRNIVVALGLKGDVFRAKGFQEEADLAWRHSLATAIAAGVIATVSRRVEKHRAFLGGLLHNVGYGVVLRAAVELSRLRPLEADALRAEIRPVAAALFRETGGLVARRWKLDEGLYQVITHSDRPHLAREAPQLALHVALGRAAAFEVGLGPAEPDGQYSRCCLRRALDLPAGFDEQLLEALPGKFEAYESSC